jgi:hypothetical protein
MPLSEEDSGRRKADSKESVGSAFSGVNSISRGTDFAGGGVDGSGIGSGSLASGAKEAAGAMGVSAEAGGSSTLGSDTSSRK